MSEDAVYVRETFIINSTDPRRSFSEPPPPRMFQGKMVVKEPTHVVVPIESFGRTNKFSTVDRVLPQLTLNTPCQVDIVISDDEVRLSIGPRDFVWSKIDGRVLETGCSLKM